MENFEFVSPTHFVFGHDAEAQVGTKLAERGATRVLLHYGGKSAQESGLLDRIRESLAQAGVAVVELGGVRPNPEITLVREGVRLCKEHQVDWVLAVGGGSVVDSAKAIAVGAPADVDVWHFYETKEQTDDILPIAVVLTIPAAGSEASKNAVVSNDELGMKTGYANNAQRPKLAFLNPELTFTLPPFQTAAGLTDMFCHLLERFFDDVGAVPVTDNLNLSLMKTIRAEAPRVLADPENYDARANIMWTGMLCHQGLAGVGRHEDWATHGLEHELSAFDTSITHGAGLAVLFPAWMEFVCDANPARFAFYGREVFGLVPTGDVQADALSAIDETRAFFASLGMPVTLTELGLTEETLEEAIDFMLPTLRINKGEPFGSFKPLTMEDAAAIYRMAL
ncbi:iron-containing alcohol dehydrogenase [Xiamenia xianingshaonis]|uniref:Iron-containing alcohol dehydrogenase n=1 Tax=Xiamenia xianingshaonis TaxID=2682776 RepID=A0A9E6MPS6_9ACTN|nr:iron-containing alcohol dehydrogenase [Xiamenia xianingshaonis]NHM14252.1 iron-containing alcohol dehydrogenase [Xiamenia xianingshaonis]NHM16974.1 iron-containing alcohol dehydrogenase [Xiamenia xianingshaonis]QTU84138.1 iron-containing alcohol dehydrogenase [Xiamenia xianingshaonis]